MGRVGLPTAVSFARRGNEVVGVDTDVKRVDALREGKTPFFEPNLENYLKDAILRRTFTVSTDRKSCSDSDVIFITVGTPCNDDGSIDLTHLESAAAAIGESIRDSHESKLVVVRSTVVPGTTRYRVKPLLEMSSGKRFGTQFGLCANPEFLREGHAIEDTENPNRILIGSEDKLTSEKLANVWREFAPGVPQDHILLTTPENVELMKYASNAFLATRISFINTIANIAERVRGADVTSVAHGIGLDPRIGPESLNAGLGWGGSCFPKDLKALQTFCRTVGYHADLIEATREVNSKQPLKAVEFAKRSLGSLDSKRIAVLGLSFKPDTDDMREAVSIRVVREFLKEGASVVAYDPAAGEEARRTFGATIHYASNASDCLKGSDLAVLVTEWDEFKKLRPKDFLAQMKTPIVYDGRRIYNPVEMWDAGVKFGAVGLGPT